MSKYLPKSFNITLPASGYHKDDIEKFQKHPLSKKALAKAEKIIYGEGKIKFISEYTLKLKRNLLAITALNLFICLSGEFPSKIVTFEMNLINHKNLVLWFLLAFNTYYVIYFYYSYLRDYILVKEEISRVLYHEITDEKDFADPKHGWMFMCMSMSSTLLPDPISDFPITRMGLIEITIPFVLSIIVVIYSIHNLGII